jgi:pyruvate dehydrogenase E1 component beta subunit
MAEVERVAENLNRALHALFAAEPELHLLGEDIADPYGGAFKITRGLSTRFGERVRTTPLSEAALVGIASGLALGGGKAIVEMMFGDFIALAFDQILNFASKSVAMYGRRVPLHLIVRCPTGGNRGYGPTHSQSPQKHFLGIPRLSLFEMSPFHDNYGVFDRMFSLAEPCIFFEDKVLYTRPMCRNGHADNLFQFDFLDEDLNFARAFVADPEEFDCVIIAPGGIAERALSAMRVLMLEEEICCQLIVPSRLYPFDFDPLWPMLARARLICVVEESVAGGTWGSEIAQAVHTKLWGTLRRPVLLIHSRDSIIPAAGHLERSVLVQDTTIHNAILEGFRG